MGVALSEEPEFKGKYEFLSTIGAGGMGVIYKARQIMLDKIVAIKMLHAHLVTEESLQRFQLEGQTASRLAHPYIVSVFDFGTTYSGQSFMIMDYVEGVTLGQLFAESGQLPLPRLLRIFVQCTEALGHAHKKGVFHRDIKPSNIMLVRTEKGTEEVRIMDFGIAKLLEPDFGSQQLTKTGEALGSPLYMSPEQARGMRTDHRSDIYSLGCVLYEALTGGPPFIGKTALDTMMLHNSTLPAPISEASLGSSVDPALEAITMTMLEKDPEKRFQTMDDVRARLVELQDSQVAGRNLNRFVVAEETNETTESSKNRIWLLTGIATMVIGITIAIVWGFGHAINPAAKPTQIAAGATTGSPSEIDDTSDQSVDKGGAPSTQQTSQSVDGAVSARELLLEQVHKCSDDIDIELDRYLFMKPPTDDDLSILKGDPFLRHIKLKGAHEVTDRGLENLKGLKLTTLDVDGTSVRDLHAIKNMSTLTFLAASECVKLDSKGMATIGHLPNLGRLELQKTLIKDADLGNLYGFRKMQAIDLSSCPNLTQAGVSKLRAKLPSTIVLYSGSAGKPDAKQGAAIEPANRLFKAEKYKEAIRKYRASIQQIRARRMKAPDQLVACYTGIGDCYAKLGENDKAKNVKYIDGDEEKPLYLRDRLEAKTSYLQAYNEANKNERSELAAITSAKVAEFLESIGEYRDSLGYRNIIMERFGNSYPADVDTPSSKQRFNLFVSRNCASLARAAELVGNKKLALTAYTKALSAADASGESKTDEAENLRVEMGELQLSLGDFAAALKTMQPALHFYNLSSIDRMRTQRRRATFDVAKAMAKTGQSGEAVELVKSLIDTPGSEEESKQTREAHFDFLIEKLKAAGMAQEADKYQKMRKQPHNQK